MTDEGRQILYDEFCNEFAKLLVQPPPCFSVCTRRSPIPLAKIAAFPERLNYYVMTCVEAFRSNWTTIRANGAVFSGFLLGNLTAEQRKGTTLNPAMATSCASPLSR